MMIIFALLAIPLKSYLQPLVIMSVIPFGAIGAITSHYLMGEPLVFFSMLGMVALSGVVVNASLVLVDYINRQRRAGVALWDAVARAGVVRFRAIVLTSTTTFIGLAPLIADSNWATAFVIPMAISLAFGVLFATVITLFLVPSLYLILEDFLNGLAKLQGKPGNLRGARSFPKGPNQVESRLPTSQVGDPFPIKEGIFFQPDTHPLPTPGGGA